MVYRCPKCEKLAKHPHCNTCGESFSVRDNILSQDNYESTQFLAGIEMAGSVLKNCGGGCGSDAFVQGFVCGVSYGHRTEQQGVGRLIRALILHFASCLKRGFHDGRNEATVKMCDAMKKTADESYLPYI